MVPGGGSRSSVLRVAGRTAGSAALKGGAGLVAFGVGAGAVIAAEVAVARRIIGTLDDPVREASGWYGRGLPGPPIRFALLGDSLAAGYGAPEVVQTPGARLASGLADRADRRVQLKVFAAVGAQTSDLAAQVDRALAFKPHLAVIIIGGNDATHFTPISRSVARLREQVRRLTEAGCRVVVGTCPDLGTIRPVYPPLRNLGRIWSRHLAAQQAEVTAAERARAVSLGTALGPDFSAAPALLFGTDRFHPSMEGYANLSSVLLPSMLAALGYVSDEEEWPDGAGAGVVPLAGAGQEAASVTGTEVDGSERGRRLRPGVVALRRRRAQAESTVETPLPTEGALGR